MTLRHLLLGTILLAACGEAYGVMPGTDDVRPDAGPADRAEAGPEVPVGDGGPADADAEAGPPCTVATITCVGGVSRQCSTFETPNSDYVVTGAGASSVEFVAGTARFTAPGGSFAAIAAVSSGSITEYEVRVKFQTKADQVSVVALFDRTSTELLAHVRTLEGSLYVCAQGVPCARLAPLPNDSTFHELRWRLFERKMVATLDCTQQVELDVANSQAAEGRAAEIWLGLPHANGSTPGRQVMLDAYEVLEL